MVATRAGFLAGQEVVEVRFDPKTLPFDELLAHAEKSDCARTVWATSERQLAAARDVVGDRARKVSGPIRPDGEPKYYLFQSALAAVPMPELQAIRVNARIEDATAEALLSPRQKELLAAIRAHPDAPWPNAVGATDLQKAWDAADGVRAELEKSKR